MEYHVYTKMGGLHLVTYVTVLLPDRNACITIISIIVVYVMHSA